MRGQANPGRLACPLTYLFLDVLPAVLHGRQCLVQIGGTADVVGDALPEATGAYFRRHEVGAVEADVVSLAEGLRQLAVDIRRVVCHNRVVVWRQSATTARLDPWLDCQIGGEEL